MPIGGKVRRGEKCVYADTLVHNFGTPPIPIPNPNPYPTPDVCSLN